MQDFDYDAADGLTFWEKIGVTPPSGFAEKHWEDLVRCEKELIACINQELWDANYSLYREALVKLKWLGSYIYGQTRKKAAPKPKEKYKKGAIRVWDKNTKERLEREREERIKMRLLRHQHETAGIE